MRRFCGARAGFCFACGVMLLPWLACAQPGGPSGAIPSGPMPPGPMPSNVPATRPAGPGGGATPAPPLPSQFQVLQSRDPFAHGGKGGPAGPGGPGGPGAPGGPDTLFVLRGTVGAGDDFTAFVEDTTAKRFLELSAGAPLGPGRVKRIDADGIEFEESGKSRRVEVGQDLAGHVVPPIPASQPAGPQPPPGQGPPQGPPNVPQGPGPRPGKGGPPQGPQPVQAPQ